MKTQHLVSFEKTVMVMNIDDMLRKGFTVTQIMSRNELYIERTYLEIVQYRVTVLETELQNAETKRLEDVAYAAIQALEDHLKSLR